MLLHEVHQTSSDFSYRQGMKARTDLRAVVAHNVRVLMERRDWTQMQLHAESKVSQRHISSVLNMKTALTFETLDALAAAFKLPGWALLLPEIPVELLDSQKIPLLVGFYKDAGPEGRDLIDRQAEREAHHNREKSKVVHLQKVKSR
jgi:transcriptional regulator with XRE-family HTH domain